MIREDIVELLKKACLRQGFGGQAAGDESVGEVSVPEIAELGHYSTNVALRLAKARGAKPMDLADEIVGKLRAAAPAGMFEKIEVATPGFINFWLTKEAIQKEFEKIIGDEDFGKSDFGQNKKIIVEYSSVNIAKPFHLGHFRNTIIGDALARILKYVGYDVVRWNYLGDWGTQFGKLIVAYRLWGDENKVKENPIEELQKLYVKFHEEVKTNPELDQRAREEFQKLEAHDPENLPLWLQFKNESLKAFERIYKTLDVDFDIWIGESFFEDQMEFTVQELLDKKIAEKSEGAIIVKLDSQDLPPALIQKADGASLYLTRDIANLRYRLQTYKPAKILYVVGNEQSLHFEQLFAIAKILGLDSAELIHIKYGLVLGETGKKLSTRRGEGVAINEILEKVIKLARSVVEEKARDLSSSEKDAVAHAVTIGALKYNDLKENRTTDILFDWDRMLSFSGDSGPYLQYTHARLKSILRKAEVQTPKSEINLATLDSDAELVLMRKIFEFPYIILRAANSYATSVLATYLNQLAGAANHFYESTPILVDENRERKAARLQLVETTAWVLKAGLYLLGIQAPEKI